MVSRRYSVESAPIRISQPRERSPSRRRRHADAALAHGAHPTGRSDAQAREPPTGRTGLRPPVGTARRRRAAGRTPSWSRPATAWCQHQQNPLQRGVAPLQRGVSARRPRSSVVSPGYSVESAPIRISALAESQKAPRGRCTGAWRPPHRAERRAGKGTPTSQFVGAGTARRRRAAGRTPSWSRPATASAVHPKNPLQRGVAPLQRGVSTRRTRYSVESRFYSVESAPADRATAWCRAATAWSQRQQTPLQRGVARLQRGVSACRPRSSVESRFYSVESAPTDPATAWSRAERAPDMTGGGRCRI